MDNHWDRLPSDLKENIQYMAARMTYDDVVRQLKKDTYSKVYKIARDLMENYMLQAMTWEDAMLNFEPSNIINAIFNDIDVFSPYRAKWNFAEEQDRRYIKMMYDCGSFLADLTLTSQTS